MKAIVLVSGGMDSAVCLAASLKLYKKVYPVTFYYGQKNSREILSAKRLVDYYRIESRKTPLSCKLEFIQMIDVPLHKFGQSALTDKNIPIPKEKSNGIPPTYVPGRNTVFLSVALSYLESVGVNDIVIGANATDYTGYPDCRSEYFDAFEIMASTALNRPITIETPVLNKTKKEIVKWGEKLEVPWHLTWSCYEGGEKACGKCDACRLRLQGFKEAGVKDPLEYE